MTQNEQILISIKPILNVKTFDVNYYLWFDAMVNLIFKAYLKCHQLMKTPKLLMKQISL